MERFCRKLFSSLFSLLVICLLASTSQATSVVMLSDQELIVSSRAIITGEVQSVTSAWDEGQNTIWTYVEVHCDRALKGGVGTGRLVLKQMGGASGQMAMRVYGQPEFTPGQRVLLYLNTAPDGSLRVAHAFMGAFSIVWDPATGRDMVIRSSASREVEILPRSIVEPVTDQAPLHDYINRIGETLVREAAQVEQFDAERSGHPMIAVPAEYSRIKEQASGYNPSFAFMAGGVRWMQSDSGQPVVFYVNPANAPIAGGGSAELARAMSAWSAQSGAQIILQSAGQTGRCGSEGDDQNTISFADCRAQLDPPVGGCSGVVAQTNIFYMLDSRVINGRPFYRLVDADIVFNRGMDCFLSNSANLAEVACHELGHAIGLDHSADGRAIMFAVAHGRGFDATLADDDKAGVQAIYPGSSTPPPPLPSQNDATFVSQTVPATMTAGQIYTVSVTMLNSGNSTWTAPAYKLGSQNPQDNTVWGVNRVNVSSSVAPGAQATFTFSAIAPSTPGVYSFRWRMLQEGSGYFGSAGANAQVTVNGPDTGGNPDTGTGGPVAITSLNLVDGVVGRSYKQQLSAKGGTPPYRWTYVGGTLPTGLSVSPGGLIEGVPSQTGTFSFGIQVFDKTGSLNNADSRRLSITISDASNTPTIAPIITRVKIKGTKKLFIYGLNFNQNSLVQLNGTLLQPTVRTQGDGSILLFYKGRLSLNEAGANVLFVLNAGSPSAAFVF